MVCNISQAQKDTFSLQEVSILAPRGKIFDVGNERLSIQNHKNSTINGLSDKLMLVTSATLKQNSVGGLQSFSLRGTAPRHNAILWNGVNLQSSMNGGVDMSLLSLPIFDDISIVTGGQSALHGSGAIGGVLDLGSSLQRNTKVYQSAIYGGFGSFGERFGSVSFTVQKAKNDFQIRYFHLQSDNNFEYRFGANTYKNINAELKTDGALLAFQHRFSASSYLKFDAWVQQSDRNIPPSVTESNAKANQKDAAMRLNLDFVTQQNSITLKSKVFFSSEKLDFESLTTTLAKSEAKTLLFEQEMIKKLSRRSIFSIGAQLRIDGAKGPKFQQYYIRNRVALWTAFRFEPSKKLTFTSNLRIERLPKNEIPVTAQFGFLYKLKQNAHLKASLSKNYNTPTFNDLYWPQLGNPDLKPENAYTGNVSFHTFTPVGFSIAHFQNHVTNWIEWAPYQGALFRPRNIWVVWSRGLELRLNKKINISSKQSLDNQLSYSYIKTTYEKGVDSSSLHKQLTYNPLHNLSLTNTYLLNQKWNFMLSHIFTSKRYVTSDNQNALNPLVLGNFTLSYTNKFKQNEYSFTLTTNNIWNTPYQSIQYRPMPERRFIICLNLKI